MAMVLDSRSQPHLGGLHYDPNHPMRYPAPQFPNPWTSLSNANAQHQLYNSPFASSIPALDHRTAPRAPPLSIPYSTTSTPMHDTYRQRYYSADFAPSSSMSHNAYASLPPLNYAPEQAPRVNHQYAYDQDFSRRIPYQPPKPVRTSFGDAYNASRGMLPMSQDTTPRNVYGQQITREGSHDSYGFPSAQSTPSSTAGTGFYASSYSGSVDGSSATDYSSASEEQNVPRVLPAPIQLINGFPPEPQSMMTQFSSKVSPDAQKKHACKLCPKRFTRPSSLQTHVYSHTGEKPFACDVEGCGRHFSVVSNLRRHRKVHKDERDHTSPETD